MAPVIRPLVSSYVGADTSDPVVALTFDDGPDPARTPAVLEVLRAHRARATFFVLGDAAARHPELIRSALDDGHEIALHSASHVAMPSLSPRGRVVALRRGRRVVRDVAGTAPRWFRAPYGKQTGDTVLAARLLGMRSVMWSAYAREWEDHPVDACIAFAAPGVVAGGIVLLHDGSAGEGADEAARPASEIVDLVRGLLATAEERGLRAVTVGELLQGRAARRRVWLRSWRVDDA